MAIFRGFDLESMLIGFATIEVTPEQLYKTSDRVLNEINSVKYSFDRIFNLVKNTSNYWNGKVADKERKELESNKTEISNMMETLRIYTDELNQIATNYIETEEAVTDMSQDLPSNILS